MRVCINLTTISVTRLQLQLCADVYNPPAHLQTSHRSLCSSWWAFEWWGDDRCFIVKDLFILKRSTQSIRLLHICLYVEDFTWSPVRFHVSCHNLLLQAFITSVFFRGFFLEGKIPRGLTRLLCKLLSCASMLIFPHKAWLHVYRPFGLTGGQRK